MSASKAAEMIVHHTQAASYHQGREAAYAEAMRLVRTAKHAAASLPMAEVLAMLERTETTLYDFAQQESTLKDRRNAVLREAAALLTDADTSRY
jgi:hypothetical protein